MLPTDVKDTIDLLHLLVENYQRKQLHDTEYQKCGDLFLEVDERTNLARRMRGISLIYDLIQEIEDAFYGIFSPTIIWNTAST
uniref:Uncharacterized protein n=1 Tax=Magallana gigas TaxID=29159 RepID=A0A8W8P2L5_MAGGI